MMSEKTPNLYYDKKGRQIDVDQAQRLRFNEDGTATGYQQVAFDSLGGIDISTTWLGIDYGFGFLPPLLFETTMFDYTHNIYRVYDRYISERDAQQGHQRAASAVRRGFPLL